MQERKTLRQLRVERGWKREQIAAWLGVSLTTIANLETGKHQPRMELARKIAELFDVSLDDIKWGKYERHE